MGYRSCLPCWRPLSILPLAIQVKGGIVKYKVVSSVVCNNQLKENAQSSFVLSFPQRQLPYGYCHLLLMLNLVVLGAALAFHPEPCPALVSSGSLPFPAVLLSQWRIKEGSIRGKQCEIRRIPCIFTLYL